MSCQPPENRHVGMLWIAGACHAGPGNGLGGGVGFAVGLSVLCGAGGGAGGCFGAGGLGGAGGDGGPGGGPGGFGCVAGHHVPLGETHVALDHGVFVAASSIWHMTLT